MVPRQGIIKNAPVRESGRSQHQQPPRPASSSATYQDAIQNLHRIVAQQHHDNVQMHKAFDVGVQNQIKNGQQLTKRAGDIPTTVAETFKNIAAITKQYEQCVQENDIILQHSDQAIQQFITQFDEQTAAEREDCQARYVANIGNLLEEFRDNSKDLKTKLNAFYSVSAQMRGAQDNYQARVTERMLGYTNFITKLNAGVRNRGRTICNAEREMQRRALNQLGLEVPEHSSTLSHTQNSARQYDDDMSGGKVQLDITRSANSIGMLPNKQGSSRAGCRSAAGFQ